MLTTPLRPNLVTAGAKIMLPTYPIFNGWLGLSYFFNTVDRASTPDFPFVGHLMAMDIWATWFVVLAAAMTIALLVGHRLSMALLLYIAAVTYLAWSIAFFVLIVSEEHSSSSALAVFLFIVAAHIASASSLLRDRPRRGAHE